MLSDKFPRLFDLFYQVTKLDRRDYVTLRLCALAMDNNIGGHGPLAGYATGAHLSNLVVPFWKLWSYCHFFSLFLLPL